MPQGRLHILFITKWYPSQEDPQLAIFVKRHAEAVAQFARVTVLHVTSSNAKTDEVDFQKEGDLTTVRAHWPQTNHPLFKLKRMFSAARKARKRMDEELPNVDLIHCHMLARTAWLAQQLYPQLPFVVTEHWTGYVNGNFQKLNPLRKIAYRKLAKKASALTVVSGQLKKAMIQNKFRRDIEIVPNVVEVPSREKKKNDRIHILTVADFHEKNKNISGILRAINSIREHYQFHWTIVGDGVDRETITSLAKDLNITDRVSFPGRLPQEEVHREISTADLLVVNSRFETFSMVTLEALLMGVPVIATRSGGPENFVNETNGFLIDPDDQAALENSLKKFLENPEKFEAEKVKLSVENRFSKDAVGSAFLNLYNRILNH
ncbi:glycosyltransferase [Halocola ammonii]